MNNEYELNFEKTLTKLAGNKLGKEIFNNQVDSSIDYEKRIYIVFPDRIDYLASSFIQGFFEKIVENIGIDGIEDRVEIKSSIPNVKDVIISNLH